MNIRKQLRANRMTLYYYSDFDNYAGIENYGYNLISLLRKHHPEINIVVLSETDKCVYESEFIALGCRVINLGFSPLKPRTFSKKISEIFSCALSGDVIQLNVCSMRNISLFKKCKRSRIKTIVVSHYSKAKGKLKILHYISRHIYRNKFINVAVSEEAGRFMFGKSKFDTIPNIIDSKKYYFSQTGRTEIRDRLGIKDDELLLGLIGRISKEKNQKFAIDVFNKLQSPNIRMVFLGKGDTTKLKKAIKKDARNRVGFCSSSPNDIYKWYSSFDLLLIPSKHESFSLVKYEGLANGLNVFISNGVPRINKEPKEVSYLKLVSSEWTNKIEEFNKSYRIGDRFNKNYDELSDAKGFVDKYIEIYNY